jgi:hypothetical protein
MGSTLMIVGEVVAPTSPAEAPPASAARGGVSTLAAATGGEVALLSTATRGRVEVRASSASASPTTRGSGNLVREGKMGHQDPLVASTSARMAKHLVKTRTCKILSKRHN